MTQLFRFILFSRENQRMILKYLFRFYEQFSIAIITNSYDVTLLWIKNRLFKKCMFFIRHMHISCKEARILTLYNFVKQKKSLENE